MATFVLKEIVIPHAKIKLYKLIDENGNCEYDDWRKAVGLAGTFADELDNMDTILIDHAQMRVRVPPSRFKELGNRKGNDPIKDYVCRTGNLRLYLFKIDEGKAVVLGGPANKTQQPQDIARMRRIKKAYHADL